MNILITAVGGQGALLASRIIGAVAQNRGKDVKVSEVHGMAQRGGSVVTYVKFANKVYAPIIEKGTADIVLAFEKLEGSRYVDYLKNEGKLIINTQEIDPMPVIVGAEDYPNDLISQLETLNVDLISVNALELAKQAGNIKTLNVVLIGILAKISDIPKEEWLKAIHQTVPERFMAVNLKAFDLGYTVKQRESK